MMPLQSGTTTRGTNVTSTSTVHVPTVSARTRRRRGLLATIGGVVAAFAIATPAAAAQPVVVEEASYDQSYTLSAAEFPCGVEVTFHEVGSTRITAFVDGDGNVVRQQGHIGGTTTVTSDHGEIVNRWRENAKLTPDGTITWSGNSYNIHGGAGGVLVNQSGHWVVDSSGEVLSAAGPQEDPFDDGLAEICAVLAP
jgi:hypothetical protein